MDRPDCQVCCEKINKSNHFEIKCNYCEYSSCRSCFQRYLIDSISDSHCMNCKKVFTHEFLSENCTSAFINKTLKEHREKVLFDSQRALLPVTQNEVIKEKNRREINEQNKLLNTELAQLKYRMAIIKNELYHNNRKLANINNAVESTTESKKFVRKCPIQDCNGFLSTQWKCGSCDSKICNKCNEPNLENHVCKSEDVATMELINKDTKPCPKCGTMIFKINGCDQMYCIDCHTPFSWTRGTIVTGHIHNPHYYEYIRRTNNGVVPRNPGDIPNNNQCGRLVDFYSLISGFRTKNLKIPDELNKKITNLHNTVTHITHVEMDEFFQLLMRHLNMNVYYIY